LGQALTDANNNGFAGLKVEKNLNKESAEFRFLQFIRNIRHKNLAHKDLRTNPIKVGVAHNKFGEFEIFYQIGRSMIGYDNSHFGIMIEGIREAHLINWRSCLRLIEELCLLFDNEKETSYRALRQFLESEIPDNLPKYRPIGPAAPQITMLLNK
jgi:hypothetical protein